VARRSAYSRDMSTRHDDAAPEPEREHRSAEAAPHLFDQTNGIYDRFAEHDEPDGVDDGNDLDADLGKFTGLGGNSGF
jgi:hypothetical protein